MELQIHVNILSLWWLQPKEEVRQDAILKFDRTCMDMIEGLHLKNGWRLFNHILHLLKYAVS